MEGKKTQTLSIIDLHCKNQMLLRPILSRLHKLQCSPNFWVGRNGAATLASAKNSALEGKPLDKGYVISYLVNSCGLSPDMATSASRLVHFDGPDKPNAVVTFLGKQGFTQSQIANLVARFPSVLVYDPEKSLLPKFEFLFRSTGISETDILKIVSKSPDLLKRSFKRRVAPVYNYVKGIIGAGNTDNLLRRGSWVFNLDLEGRLKPNVDFLREVGVPQRFIMFAFVNCTSILFSDHVELKRIVEEVKRMGFNPLKSTFILAIKARTGEGCVALWDQCIEVYSKWGWTEEDIHMAFTTHPGCMVMSEKKISTALDFLVNKLGRESRPIARCPQVLFYSLEERIVPRCSVVHLLSLEGLVEKDWSLPNVLSPIEEKFLNKFVTRYIEKMPQLYDIYLSKKASGVSG